MKLIEEAFSRPNSVDRDCMVIRGAKIIGIESRNGRTYSDSALDKLTGFYEGMSVNVDHDRSKPNPERKMADGFGVLKNVQRRADGIYGDLHYLREHSLAPMILERAERMPESFGLSHSAEGRVVRKNGKLIVEDVAAVHSVDIVREPATTNGLFESDEGGFDVAVMTIREIVEAAPEDTPDLELLVEAMDAGMIAAEDQVEVTAGANSGDMIKTAFRTAVLQAFDDESLDLKATIARIREILKAQDRLKAAEAKTDEAANEEPKEDKMKESVETEERADEVESTEEVQLTEDKDRHVALIEAENLLLKAGREATPERINAVAAVEPEARELLVESWPARDTVERPATSPPKFQHGKFEIPKDTKKFAAWLR